MVSASLVTWLGLVTFLIRVIRRGSDLELMSVVIFLHASAPFNLSTLLNLTFASFVRFRLRKFHMCRATTAGAASVRNTGQELFSMSMVMVWPCCASAQVSTLSASGR